MTRTWPSVVTVAIALLALCPAAQAAFPGRNGQIAYMSSSYSSPESGEGPNRSTIALIAGAPRGPDRLTLRTCTVIDEIPQDPDCSRTLTDPAYSPNGKLIAVDAGLTLGIIDSDGSDVRLLTSHGVDNGEPAWSPDGKKIAFTALTPGTTVRNLYVFNFVRNSLRRLTTAGARAPAWSTRNRIAYVTGYSQVFGQPTRGQITAIRPDGSERRRLTRRGGLAPAWSPHGTKLAFVRKGYLYVMNATGGGLRRVGGRRPISAEDVAWSPDGRFFAYHPFESGIFIVRTDGTGEREFESGAVSADSAYDAFAPDWRPLPRR